MSIEMLLNNPRILHQTPDEKDGMPEAPIAICNDATPIIVMSQEGRDIVINLASIPELCKELKKLAHQLSNEQAAKQID